jgi:predicted metal-dependent peptidase
MTTLVGAAIRDARVSNIAQDYVVNSDLVDQKIGRLITTVPCLYDRKYAGWAWEDVYDDLMKNAQPQTLDQLVKKLLDEHLSESSDEEGSGNSKGDNDPDSDKKDQGRPRIDPQRRGELEQEIRAAILEAAQAAGSDNLPGGIKRLIEQLTCPKLNWREILQQKIQSMFRNDYSWSRPNRRSQHWDAVMPGLKPGEMVRACVFIDVSGSISGEQARDLLSEVAGIIQSFDDYELTVGVFDTQVYNVCTYTSDNANDINEYEIVGGGGTEFDCVWRYLSENNIQPEQLIMFTDGYDFGDCGARWEGYCPTLFLIHSNPGFDPKWNADVVHYQQ